MLDFHGSPVVINFCSLPSTRWFYHLFSKNGTLHFQNHVLPNESLVSCIILNQLGDGTYTGIYTLHKGWSSWYCDFNSLLINTVITFCQVSPWAEHEHFVAAHFVDKLRCPAFDAVVHPSQFVKSGSNFQMKVHFAEHLFLLWNCFTNVWWIGSFQPRRLFI